METRSLRRVLAALFVATLLLAACGDDDTEASTGVTADSPTRDETATSVSTTVPGDADSDESPESTGEVLEVSVAGGEVTGGGRVPIELGSSVTIRVTSDVADHVHLHGYDVMVDVPAGGSADLTFDATIPGVFEVELEENAVELLELEIS